MHFESDTLCLYDRRDRLVCSVVPGRSDRSRFPLICRRTPIDVAERVRMGTILQKHASLQFQHSLGMGQSWDRGQIGVGGGYRERNDVAARLA